MRGVEILTRKKRIQKQDAWSSNNIPEANSDVSSSFVGSKLVCPREINMGSMLFKVHFIFYYEMKIFGGCSRTSFRNNDLLAAVTSTSTHRHIQIEFHICIALIQTINNPCNYASISWTWE